MARLVIYAPASTRVVPSSAATWIRTKVLGVSLPRSSELDVQSIAKTLGNASKQLGKTSKNVSKDIERVGDQAERIGKILG